MKLKEKINTDKSIRESKGWFSEMVHLGKKKTQTVITGKKDGGNYSRQYNNKGKWKF